MKDLKRIHGQFYTKGNPFLLKPFLQWAEEINLSKRCILEPFAGANNIIKMLQDSFLCHSFKSFDINPAHRDVQFRDSLEDFPKEIDICITNPPWLARNSATRRKLPFPETPYDDLYKHCLKKCLDHCLHVAALIPASFLQSNLFQDRLKTYILLHKTLFRDTENPVCLALFTSKKTEETDVFHDNKFIGELKTLERKKPLPRRKLKIRFNDPKGSLGFISFDNIKEPSIKFCHGDEISHYSIKKSSRFFTRISGELNDLNHLIPLLNKKIKKFRDETSDVFLTPFKGLRRDGCYRRRMDFLQAKEFINATSI